MEYDLGTRCTAVLTKTLYAVRDEVPPRAEDAKGSLSEIDGMVTRIEARPEVGAGVPAETVVPTPATGGTPAPVEPEVSSRGFSARRLFRRPS